MSLVASTRLVLPEKACPAAARLGPKRVAYQPSSWLRPPPCVGPGHKHTEGRGEPACAGPTGDGQPRARAHQLQRFSHCATGAPQKLGSPTRQIWRRCLQPFRVPMLLKARFAKLPVTRWAYCECSAPVISDCSGPKQRLGGQRGEKLGERRPKWLAGSVVLGRRRDKRQGPRLVPSEHGPGSCLKAFHRLRRAEGLRNTPSTSKRSVRSAATSRSRSSRPPCWRW